MAPRRGKSRGQSLADGNTALRIGRLRETAAAGFSDGVSSLSGMALSRGGGRVAAEESSLRHPSFFSTI